MCPSILSRQAAATTTSVFQVATSEIGSHEEAEFHPLHMDWVLLSDTKGGLRPGMRWLVD